ncbi:MAG: hypothetical protein M0R77_20845 [Gammaproteobacteria bacterium]|nr:hypothetical protein [Gammaproteobacteria bacterium]
MKYNNKMFQEFQLSTIKYIVEFFTDEENFTQYESSQSKTIPFLKNHSSIHKELYFDKVEIFTKSLGLKTKKISNSVIQKLINYYSNKDSKITTKDILEVNQLFNPNIYVYLPRGYLNDGGTKGASTLYPILNFYNRSKLDFSVPIDLQYSKGEEFSIYDCCDFKIFASSSSGGTHRTAGLVSSLGLLRNCKIDNKVKYYSNHFTKAAISSLKRLIEKIHENEYIDYVGMDKDKSNKIVIKYKNKIINIQSLNDIFILLELDIFKTIFEFMEDLNITSIECDNKSITFNTEDNGHISYSNIKEKSSVIALNKIIYFYKKFWNLPTKKQYFKKINKLNINKSFYYDQKLYFIAKQLFYNKYKRINAADKITVLWITGISFLAVIGVFLYFNPNILDSLILSICHKFNDRIYYDTFEQLTN